MINNDMVGIDISKNKSTVSAIDNTEEIIMIVRMNLISLFSGLMFKKI